MTPCDPGTIVLVPFPFTNQSTSKKRPAVVISSAAYNAQRPDLIIMAITSVIPPMLHLGEVIVREWQAAGLLKPSVIKPVITTIEKNLIIKMMGTLASTDQQSLRQVLQNVLG
jgi:mRNA interferase MazF